MRRAAVFLDRDGTLMADAGYPARPQDVRLLVSASESLRAFRSLGLELVLVSNQSGVGRGRITMLEARAVHDRLLELLGAEGVELDASYYCFHAPDAECRCRKPSPGLLLDAAADRGLALERSFVIGDRRSDIAAGKSAGCRTVLLRIGAGAGEDPADDPGSAPGADPQPDCLAGSWEAAREFVEERARSADPSARTVSEARPPEAPGRPPDPLR